MNVRAASWLALVLGFSLVVAPSAPSAQPRSKIIRIGILTLSTASWVPNADGFKQELKRLGYVEGENIALVHRDAAGKSERLPALADELVRLKIDVIVTQSNVATLAAKRATRDIPIVMAIAGDPVKAGIVESLAHPGGNVTGLTLMQTELSGKRLELLKELIPSIRLVAVIWNPADPPAAGALRETEAAARSLGVKVHAIEARSTADLEGALRAAATVHPDAFFTLPGGMFQDNLTRIVQFTKERGLPGAFPSREFAEAGALLSYAPSLGANWRRAAVFVDRVLKGARPADIPIEQPTRFEMIINLKTAKALHVTIPASTLARADVIIE